MAFAGRCTLDDAKGRRNEPMTREVLEQDANGTVVVYHETPAEVTLRQAEQAEQAERAKDVARSFQSA